jgi:hypothetical protein
VTDRLADPFDTAALRARVLDAWAASPSRFREDANAEEDYALGGYRDRVVVELAQNAADAAVRAGVPGRLRLTLRDGTLVAANAGAPLDTAGVEALSTLRASSKRDDSTGPDSGPAAGGGTVGRFGVGFAAVVAVSDTPRIHSLTGTVGWSRDRSRDLAGAIPALTDELAARSGQVPVLRLPFAEAGAGTADETLPPEAAPDTDGLPAGFATAVELPLRDEAAVGLVTRLLAQTGPALLLALPALAQVEIVAAGTTRLLTAVHGGGLSTVTVNGVPSMWRVTEEGGELDPALLDGRPAEERTRTTWSVRWAVPVTAGSAIPGSAIPGSASAGSLPLASGAPPAPGADARPASAEEPRPTGRLPEGVTAVVHAPTPTDEPLSLPALLLASFPLGPDRRHVAPGALTGFLVERAADAYAGLLPGLAPGPGLLDLVPGPAGRGELDARLSRAIAARLPGVPFLPAADGAEAGEKDPDGGEANGGNSGGGERVRPRDAVLLNASTPGLTRWLAPVLPGLVTGPPRHPAWAALGVRRLSLAELADLLAALGREPAWWHGLYTALADVPVQELGELGALPVPLADGRQARGPRGLLLPGPGLGQPDRLAVLGLRVVHPQAAHPLLARLGAVEATPRSVLDDPATRAAVAASYDRAAEAYYDDDGPQQLADTVLGLVAAAGAEPGEYPWLADLALPGDDGDWYSAGELLLPDSPLRGIVADDAPFGTISEGLAQRHDAKTLEAAGVLSSFGLLTAEDVELGESQTNLELDGADAWAADTRHRPRPGGDSEPGHGSSSALAALPPVAVEVVAVRDLDLVDPDRWPQALDLLTRPPLRAALTEPTRVRWPDGRYADVPSYTAWWLRRHLILGGRRPGDLRTADSDPLLAGLYEVVGAVPGPGPGVLPDGAALSRLLADPAIGRALGVRSSLADLLTEPGGADELLSRLADPARPVTRSQLRDLWSALAAADTVSPDDITPPDRVRAVAGGKVTVADAADTLVLDSPDLWPLLAGQPLILVPGPHAARLADLLDLPLASEEVPGVIESAGEPRRVPGVLLDALPGAPAAYTEHDRLLVDGADVPWRYTGGELHAATVEGLAHGLAWAAGQWQARHLLDALLTSPDETERLLTEADLDS